MIQPFTLILSGHPEARPTPTAAVLVRVPATEARAGRTAALLVPIKAEHGGWEVQRLKCRLPQRERVAWYWALRDGGGRRDRVSPEPQLWNKR